MEYVVDIKGYEGIYKIDVFGNISNNKNIILKKFKSNSGRGYYMVGLSKNGKVKKYLVHRLVALHFIKNNDNKEQVNHIDGNKLNNFIGNLEWCTQSENMKHSINVIGNPVPPSWKGKFGKNHNRSKKIYEYDLEGNLLNTYESGLDFKRKTGISNTSASWSIKNKKPIFNKQYKHE